jgi:glycosyltransferase involved in cell wall biosynthesis
VYPISKTILKLIDKTLINTILPKVTVFMPVYNGQAYIKLAIESILNQSFQDFELVIINDGSTDGSVKIVEEFDDSRIRLIHNKENKGLVFTRNRGFEEAKGEYFAILDCDDWAYPQRLEKQVNFLNQNPDFGLVGTSVELIDANDKITGAWNYTLKPELIPPTLLFHNYFAQSSIMLRLSIEDLNYRTEFPPVEDYDLWYRIAQKHKVWTLPEVLVKYRIHDQNISKTQEEKAKKASIKILENQLQDLAISASAEELALHRKIGRSEVEKSLSFFEEAEKWLLSLKNKNKKYAIYNQKALEELIDTLFLTVCSVNHNLGWRVFKSILANTHWTLVNYKQKTKLLLLSLSALAKTKK